MSKEKDCQHKEQEMKVMINEYDEGLSIHLQEEGDILDINFGKQQLEHEFGKPVKPTHVEFKDGKPVIYYLFEKNFNFN